VPPVGRPRTRTNTGSSAPINEIGIPDVMLGSSWLGWNQFIDEHEFVPELRWPNSVIMYDQMRTDSQLAALFTAVAWGISQLRYLIDENGARKPIVNGISEDLNLPIRGEDDQPRGRLKKRFSHSHFISQALLALLYGHMYFEQVGEIVNGQWRLRKLAPRMPQSIQEIKIADDGGLISIVQNMPMNKPGSINPPEVPVDRLVAFIFQQEGPNWVGRSMFRDCYKDWLIKDRLVRIDAINHERAGGVPYVEAPMGATPSEVDDLNVMAQKFRIGESSGGALPFGAKLNIARGTGSDVDKSIHSRDEAMARRFLLQLMNLAQSGQHVGSYALGETFEDFFIVGQRHIAQWYCDTMTEHVIEDWVDWNYGEDEKLVPQLTWERTSEDALGVDQLSLLVQRGVIQVDDELENAIRYKYRLPKRTGPRQEEISPGGPKQPTEQQAAQNPALVTGAETGPGAPSSQSPAPAPVKASVYDWERDEIGPPHVMAAAQPSLVTVPNVPILEAGVEYQLSTGATTFTPEDLADAVTAANEDPSIPSPRLKIGHIDPRFNGKEFDGTPSFGLMKNLRLSDNGMKVYADFQGVPKWLADIMPTAFPNRSVEGYWGIPSHASDKKWSFVLSACALLGVTWPGVRQLEDLPKMYQEEVPEGVVIDPELIAAGGDPVKLFGRKDEASANLDDVRRAFYNDYVAANAEAKWWWIRQVLVDPNELIVENDETGELYKIPYNSGAQGSVSFGDPESVRQEWVPVDQMKAAAAHVAAALAVGREVLASYESRAESSPDQGGGMDPKEIRKRLGLPEDATNEQVQDSLRELNEAAVANATPNAVTDEGVTAVSTNSPEERAVSTTASGEEPPATPEVTSVAASTPPADSGVVQIDKETLEQLKAGAQAGLALRSEMDAGKRETLVAAAIGDGRIPPSRKDHWLKNLEADFEGFSQTLSSLEPGLVPVDERGSNETVEQASLAADDQQIQRWTDSLYPEVAARRQRVAAASAAPPQIMREEGL